MADCAHNWITHAYLDPNFFEKKSKTICSVCGIDATEALSRVEAERLKAERDRETLSRIADLSYIPEGWWLYGLFHNHTPIQQGGQIHVPFDKAGIGDPWTCKLQRETGGFLSEGSGTNPKMAVNAAIEAVLERMRRD